MGVGDRGRSRPSHDRHRWDAERRLERRLSQLEDLAPEALAELAQQLEAHQIELELQNEELREAQRQLKRARDSYEDLYEQAPLGYLTVTADGAVRQANRTAIELLGIEPRASSQDLASLLNSVDRRDLSEHLAAACATAARQTCEVRATTPRGVRRLRLTSQRRPDGLCRLALEDITGEREAEEATLAERDQLLRVFDAMRDGVFIADERNELVYGNGALVDQFGPYEGRHYFEYLRGVAGACAGQAPVATEPSRRVEWFCSETDRCYEIIISALTNPDGRPAHLGVLRDVTEQRRAKHALLAADRQKDEYLATLAHELRGPLAPMRYAAQTIAQQHEPGPALDAAREVVTRQVGHMSRLVDDLLDVSRITCGELRLRREEVDLCRLVARVAKDAQVTAGSTELLAEICDEPLLVHGDPVRLVQIVGNLVDNALKFAPHGQVLVSTRRRGETAEIRVADDGEGIAAADLGRIFEMFGRGSRSASGLGVGLALARKLVELHGGTIVARSRGLGRGAVLSASLPLWCVEQPCDDRGETGHPMDPSSGQSLRVLLVDDNHDATDSLAQLLSGSGHDVQVAYDGCGALARAAQHLPDVVLLDIGLPDADGYATARQLRQLPGLEQTLLVAVTGLGRAHDRQQASAAGFDHYFTKPVEPTELERLLLEHHRGCAELRGS